MRRFLGWWKNYGKTLVYAFNGMEKENLGMVASGLVYSTLVAAIPCITFLIAFLSQFGVLQPFMDLISDFLAETLGEATGQEVLGYISRFSSNAMSLGLAGLVSFIIAGILLVDKIYISINQIFHIKPTSGTVRRFSTFLTFIIVGAFMIAAFFSLQAMAGRYLSGLAIGRPIPERISSRIAMAITLWGFLFLLYMAVPSAKIRFSSASIGAATGLVMLYIATSIFRKLSALMVSQSVIYGSLATLFISLLYVYMCWFVVLYSAEITYIHQFNPEKTILFGHVHTPAMQISDAMTIVLLVAYKHRRGEGATTLKELMSRLRVPSAIISSYLSDLENGGVLMPVNPRKSAFVPYKPLDQILVKDIIRIIYGDVSDETLGEEIASQFLSSGLGAFGNDSISDILERV